MSDQRPVIQAAHNTPEQVALALFHMIANVERRAMHHQATGDGESADRDWILDTYGECILTIREPQARLVSPPRFG